MEANASTSPGQPSVRTSQTIRRRSGLVAGYRRHEHTSNLGCLGDLMRAQLWLGTQARVRIEDQWFLRPPSSEGEAATMNLECTVVFDGQVLRPETPLDLPKNARFQVTLTPLAPASPTSEGPSSPWQVLRQHAGSIEGPEDWAKQLDHYLYGHPKQPPEPNP